MGTKTVSRRNEIYIIIGIVIALCACCGTWLAVPQLQQMLARFIGKPATQVPAPAGSETSTDNGKTYTVTIINDAQGYLRFDSTYVVAPEQLITFEVGGGLRKIPIEYSYNGGTNWGLNTSLELDLIEDVTFNCKDRSAIETTFNSFGVILGLLDYDQAYGVNCKKR